MKILIDESLPKHLEQMLIDHGTDTVQGIGWAGIKNGDLISKAEAIYDPKSVAMDSAAISSAKRMVLSVT